MQQLGRISGNTVLSHGHSLHRQSIPNGATTPSPAPIKLLFGESRLALGQIDHTVAKIYRHDNHVRAQEIRTSLVAAVDHAGILSRRLPWEFSTPWEGLELDLEIHKRSGGATGSMI